MVSAHGGHGFGHSLEVVETVIEVADVAWKAYEHHREGHGHSPEKVSGGEKQKEGVGKDKEEAERDVVQLRADNCRLKAMLKENLNLLQSLSTSPVVSTDCPNDFYLRLVAAVESSSFLCQLEALQKASADSTHDCFPFKEVQGEDLTSLEILIYDDSGEPSKWLWVTQAQNAEEFSGIDNESYVVIKEEYVIDGIANFMAKCIIANPRAKRLSPDELQKTVARALGGMKDWSMLKSMWKAGKLIYALSTWGIALSALYSNRGNCESHSQGCDYFSQIRHECSVKKISSPTLTCEYGSIRLFVFLM